MKPDHYGQELAGFQGTVCTPVLLHRRQAIAAATLRVAERAVSLRLTEP